MESFGETNESEWNAVDLALCHSKFSHLKSVEFRKDAEAEEPLENPHAFFQRVLPNSYGRGILWYRRRFRGM